MGLSDRGAASLRGREHAPGRLAVHHPPGNSSTVRLDSLFFMRMISLCNFCVFSHTFFWRWCWGGGCSVIIVVCSAHAVAAGAKENATWSRSVRVFGAFHSSNTQQQRGQQSTPDTSVGSVLHASLFVTSSERLGVKMRSLWLHVEFPLTIEPTVAQTWRWNVGVRIVNNSGVCAATARSELYTTFTSQLHVKFRPISTNDLDIYEVYLSLLPKLELYYINHIYFHAFVFLNNYY